MSGFTDEQIEAIEWFKGPLLVIGTPGSRKTTVIVNRINNVNPLAVSRKCLTFVAVFR